MKKKGNGNWKRKKGQRRLFWTKPNQEEEERKKLKIKENEERRREMADT
jgi:hypothetical protein